MYWIHAFTLCQKWSNINSNPIHTTFIAEWFHSRKVIQIIWDSSSIVWMDGLSDIGSNPICDESSIVWIEGLSDIGSNLICDESSIVWMEGLSDIGSNPICDESSILWIAHKNYGNSWCERAFWNVAKGLANWIITFCIENIRIGTVKTWSAEYGIVGRDLWCAKANCLVCLCAQADIPVCWCAPTNLS